MKKIFRYILLSFALMMLVACGKPDSQKAFEKGFKETMTDINKKMNEGGNEATKMIAKILEKATYKVNKVEENGNVSELDVTIKAVDLTKYLSEFMLSLKPMIETNMGEEAFTKATVDYFSDLSKKDLDYTETNIKVLLRLRTPSNSNSSAVINNFQCAPGGLEALEGLEDSGL